VARDRLGDHHRGRQTRRRGHHRRDRGRHDRVPDRRAPGKLGGPLPRQQPRPGASVARASPPRATAGWPMSSPSAPGPLPEAVTPTWPPSSGGWPGASARRRPRSPWATPSW
jgi:hypothetical protein